MNNPDAGYVELIFIDSNGDARKTGILAACDTWAETQSLFATTQAVQCDPENADFLCDLHDCEGAIVDTIGLTREAAERVTGQKLADEADYVRLDQSYWSQPVTLH